MAPIFAGSGRKAVERLRLATEEEWTTSAPVRTLRPLSAIAGTTQTWRCGMDTHRSSVLSALPAHDRDLLLQKAVSRSLGHGQVVLLAGDECDRVYLLVQGLMKLVRREYGGKETIIGLALPGDLIGEVAFLDGGTQPADAITITPARVLSIDPDLLAQILLRSSRATVELARCLSRRLRWTCETAVERSSVGITERMAGRLLDLAVLLNRAYGPGTNLELPLAQTELGELAGISRESACRALKTFKDQGAVDYTRKKLRILRPDVLRRIRCAGRVSGPYL
jgi:CRP/FNR family transcriptional regulator